MFIYTIRIEDYANDIHCIYMNEQNRSLWYKINRMIHWKSLFVVIVPWKVVY